jgi:hypothetical protein
LVGYQNHKNLVTAERVHLDYPQLARNQKKNKLKIRKMRKIEIKFIKKNWKKNKSNRIKGDGNSYYG